MSNSVRKRSAKIEAMAECWPMIKALLGGTAAMRAAGNAYLPQWPNEDSAFYNARLNTATLFPAFARTIDVLCAKPFSRPIIYGEDTPKTILEYCEDIDLQGRNMHSFAASIMEEAMAYGICGLLVDYPQVTDVKTRADEKRAGVRPYFVQIPAESLLDYDSKRINGVETFTQLRFLENITEKNPADKFDEKTVEQVRVLYPGKWETYREKQNAAGDLEWLLFEEGVTTLTKIPFVPVYGKRLGFMEAMAPLRELAFMNVEHWQSKSDQQTILHVARVPILFGTGFEDDDLTIGAACAVTSESPDATLSYVEHSGKAIESGRVSILDIEDRMRQVGAELLVIKPGKTTVAQTLADNEPGMCALQRVTQDVEDSMDQAMQLMAEWIGEPEGGHLTIYNDFGAASLAEASADLLLEMNVAGVLSNETLFGEIQRRGMVKDGIAWAEEQKRIGEQPQKQGVTLPGV
ncbi:DUF4055 domain-containing protein [Pseudomonas sp. MWU12-2345]|uniref:DUF4055 domain-containing protein n=1 Tax=Pseudomonas sp. MWU12-2345 TaxID=2928689 RepID=UPI00200DDE33|nr:DUF4055 domain-containing protein [Pseudomonas sp. MWU12-2345]